MNVPVFVYSFTERYLGYFQFLANKNKASGQSNDGGVGGCGVRISSQLGQLPGTGGGPRTPNGMGGIPT